jgi:lipopolysaccharide transport system permease protein
MAAIVEHNVRLEGRTLALDLRVDQPATLGCHWIDPATGRFLRESEWVQSDHGRARMLLHLPAVPGVYRFFISPRNDDGAWAYTQNEPILVVDLDMSADGSARAVDRIARVKDLPRPSRWKRLAQLLASPFATAAAQRHLIASMVERDILARYRGSIADAFWAILNPLILMLTYYFIFGIVLETRFPGDPSRHGYTLYFLAGMLPWLAISEALGRAPNLARENRNLITKLIFPLEILPLNLTLAGLVTGLTALLIYFGFLLFARGGVPPTALYLPLVLLPQFLFTAGLCFALSALGVFLRDLVYIVSLSLTLWFFLTPICYPETSLPQYLLPILGKNPVFLFVRAYRLVLVEGRAPEWLALAKLTALSIAVFYAGFLYFAAVKKRFADVV